MVNRKAIDLAAGATTVAALAWLYMFSHPHPPAIDPRPHQGAGEVLAQEALEMLQPNARLIVIARDTATFQMPAETTQLESFVRTVKQAGKSVSILRLLKVDPLRVVSVPPGDFFDLLRQSRESDVIVSFLGPPELSTEQVDNLGAKRPRVLAMCSGALPERVDLKQLFAQKLLHAAVVSRPDASVQAATDNVRRAFEQMFKLVRTENASERPSLSAAHR